MRCMLHSLNELPTYRTKGRRRDASNHAIISIFAIRQCAVLGSGTKR
jgi:hypothetical protein